MSRAHSADIQLALVEYLGLEKVKLPLLSEHRLCRVIFWERPETV